MVKWQNCSCKKSNKPKYSDKVRSSVDAMRVLIYLDPQETNSVNEKLNQKINSLELIADDDEEMNEALNTLKEFRAESYKHGGRINRINDSIRICQEAIKKTENKQIQRELSKKISELEKQKA